jgi:hypothetical protein
LILQDENWWERDRPTGPQRHPQRSVSTAGWCLGGPSGHSASISSPSDARRHRRQRDDQSPLDAGALGGLCPRCWCQVLAIDQRLASAGRGQHEQRPVQAVT